MKLKRPALKGPLAIPAFRAIWLGFALSSFGGTVQAVGAAWLMTSIAGSADWVALVQASTTLPIMLFSIFAGALADNFDRRQIMLVAQTFMFLASLLLVALTQWGAMTPMLLLGFTFLIGCGTALNNPAWQASIGDVVPRNQVPAAVSLNSVAFNISRSVGPALGGLVVAAAGAVTAFAINAVSYVALIAALLRAGPRKAADPLPRESLGPAVATGLRYVFMSPNIEIILLRAFLFGFAGVSLQALLPVIARDALQGGPLVFGALLGAFGFGAVIGGVFGRHVRERLSGEWYLRVFILTFAAVLAAISLLHSLPLALIAMPFAGASWLLTLSFLNISVQLATPRWVVGRALAAYQTAAFGGMALGSWVWGVVAENWGIDTALQFAALAMLVGAATGLRFAMPSLSHTNLDPVNRFQEPPLQIDLQQRSGPIVISVEYTIPAANLSRFLRAMAERRRVRRRNGAVEWTLMRDLENADLWVETYHVANWTEYLRHHRRTTHVDAEVTDIILALHAGPDRPKVRRMLVRPPRPGDASPAAQDPTQFG